MLVRSAALLEISNALHKNFPQFLYVLIYLNVCCICNNITGLIFWNACVVKNVVKFLA